MATIATIKKLGLALVLTALSVNSTSTQLLSQTPSKPTPDPALISPETGVDYNPLRDLLTSQQWRKANEKTADLMLQATGRESQGWVPVDKINQFACWDLKTIDTLWKGASNGRFGFSVQFPIFVSTGNKPGRYVSVESYERFGDEVGWRKDGNWILFIENLNYSLDAPVGHLPYPRQTYQIYGGRLLYTALTKRMVECNIVFPPPSGKKS
jgi:hypothetical protein